MNFTKTNANSIKLEKGIDLLKQSYTNIALPNGSAIFKINIFHDDQGGWFRENIRLDEQNNCVSLDEIGIEFKVKQANMSHISAGGKRFWHIHPDRDDRNGQNEIWMTDNTLLVGLVDLRKNSSTMGLKTKVVLTPDKALYIPAGVAHGFINPNNFPISLLYFTDQHFIATDETQEHRIDPKELPFDFVEPEIM